jgi:hypothetical protein
MNQEKSAVRKRQEVAPGNQLIQKPFLNEFEVSALTGRAVSTLRNDRFLRRGIPYLKVSARSIRYRTPDVLNFMEARPVYFD